MRMTRDSVLLLFMVAFASMVASARADDSLESLLQAKADFRPVTDETLAAKKAALQQSMAALDSHLYTLGAEGRDKYRADLGLAELEESLAGEVANLPALRSSLAKFLEDREGFEADVFLNARAALRSYERAVLINGNVRSAELFAAQVEGLRNQLKEYEAKPTPEARLAIGAILGNLELGEQAEDDAVDLFGWTRTLKDAYDADERLRLVEGLWEVVYADGVLHEYEANLLRRIAGLIYVPDRDVGLARQRVLARLGIKD